MDLYYILVMSGNTTNYYVNDGGTYSDLGNYINNNQVAPYNLFTDNSSSYTINYNNPTVINKKNVNVELLRDTSGSSTFYLNNTTNKITWTTNKMLVNTDSSMISESLMNLNTTYVSSSYITSYASGLQFTGVGFTNNTTITVNSIAYNGSMYVAGAAEKFVIQTSYDGIEWNPVMSVLTSGGTSVNTVIWGSTHNLWIATTGFGIYTSPDGITWTRQDTTPVTFILWVSQLSLYIASATGNKILTSSNAITWTTRTANIASAVYYIGWNGSLLVAVGSGGNTIATSPDGTTWTGRGATVITTQAKYVAWNGTIWVAVGEGTNTIATSTDGLTWTGRGATVLTSTVNKVLWNGTIWVAVADGGGSIASSPDGSTWTARSSLLNIVRNLYWLDELWIATGQGTVPIMTSPDGITWTNAVPTQFVNTVNNTYGLSIVIGNNVGLFSMNHNNTGSLFTFKVKKPTNETKFIRAIGVLLF